MGRNRKKENLGLPKYVSRHGRWFIYRPYLGREEGFGAVVRLCPADSPRSKVWQAYEEHKEERPAKCVRWLLRAYLGSQHVKGLAPATQRNYGLYTEQICATATKAGEFGQADVFDLSPGVIRKYMDKMAERPVLANHHLQFMRAAFNWALERDMVTMNPCRGVRQFKTEHRTRYVTDAEFNHVQALAPPHIAVMMELAYLCRARQGEILRLRWDDHVKPEGLLLERSKGSLTQLIGWTPGLNAAMAMAKSLPGPRAFHVIHGRTGQPVRPSSFNSAWQRLMRKAECDRFNFHDLKRKAVTDFGGDKLKASGHRSPSMLKIYDVSVEVVDATR